MNSAKPNLVATFGSLWLKIDGSTKPGPGLSKKTRGAPIENQIRPPARNGIVHVTEFPGGPRLIEVLTASF